eukprot:scaffold1955_cov254-Pinguiococcus_pyrenoidosus.AAC.4
MRGRYPGTSMSTDAFWTAATLDAISLDQSFCESGISVFPRKDRTPQFRDPSSPCMLQLMHHQRRKDLNGSRSVSYGSRLLSLGFLRSLIKRRISGADLAAIGRARRSLL